MLYWAKEYQGRNDRMKRFFLMLCAAMVLMLPAAGALANHGAMNGQAAVYMGPSRSAYGQFAGGIDQSATIYIHTYVVDDQGGLWYHIMFDLDDGEIYGGYVEAGAVTAYGSETNEERFWGEAAGEYEKRLSAYCDLRIAEVADEKAPERMSDADRSRVVR